MRSERAMNEEGECVSRAITYRQGRGRRKGTRMEGGMHTRKNKVPLFAFHIRPPGGEVKWGLLALGLLENNIASRATASRSANGPANW